MCYVTAEATNCKLRFTTQMNNSFTSGGMSTSLNDIQFAQFIQYLKQSIKSVSIKKAACNVGKQKQDVWVLGPDLQIDGEGNIYEKDKEPYLWFNGIINGESALFSAEELTPRIVRPLNSNVLSEAIKSLKIVMKHNFNSAMLVLAGGIMTVHFQTVAKLFKGSPTILAVGPPETGKSTAVAVALGIAGMYTNGDHACKRMWRQLLLSSVVPQYNNGILVAIFHYKYIMLRKVHYVCNMSKH